MSYRFPVEAGQVLLFARAIGDVNPVFHDGVHVDSVPPTFPIAAFQYDPDNPLRPKPGQPWLGSGRTACDDPEWLAQRSGGTGLHAEQHFEFHRPVRVGEVLTVESSVGDSWSKEGRSGTLVFTERINRYLDDEGRPVVTARSVAVRTQAPVSR